MNNLAIKILSYVGLQEDQFAQQTLTNVLNSLGITQMPDQIPENLPPEIEELIPEQYRPSSKRSNQRTDGSPVEQLDPDYLEKYSAFSRFIRDFGRSYAGKDEHHERYEIFAANYDAIQEHNAKYEAGEEGYLFKKGINQFSDLTKEEFNARYHGRGLKKPAVASITKESH